MTDVKRFVGVWELLAIEDFEETEERRFSEGTRGWAPAVGFEKPVGLLMYLASGEMSVNFAAASRIPFLREYSPTSSELAAAGAAYGGYAGRWEVDEARHEVIHLPEVSFVPNRVGARIRRSYSFKEDLLLLRPIAIAADDEAPNRTLKWHRRATP